MYTQYKKSPEINNKQFRRLFGFTKKTIQVMVEILCVAYATKHKRRGRHSKLDIAHILIKK